jgi:acetolactate synthase regulatory subunit
MKFTVSIRLSNNEGALERVLGRLRARSFDVSSMSAERSADRIFVDARLTVEGLRAPEPLIKQLEKLYDVVQLKVHYTEGANHGRQQQTAGQSEFCLPV